MELYGRECILEIRLVASKANMISHDFFQHQKKKKIPQVETAGAPFLLHCVKRKCKMDTLSTIMFSSSSCYCYFSESTKKNYLELLVFTSLCT